MKKVDVLCIVPPFTYGRYTAIGPKCPNLGIASVAAYLEVNNLNVQILDAFALDLDFDAIKKEIVRVSPSLVFVGSVTATHQSALKILALVKEVDPTITTVIGGPHVSNVPQSALPQADYVVINEGEETALELTQYVLVTKKIRKESIAGIAYSHNGVIKETMKRPFIQDLNKIPMPAYHLLPMDSYKAYGWLDVGRKFSTMITSRGCPFR